MTMLFHYNAVTQQAQKCKRPENCRVTTIHGEVSENLLDAYETAEREYAEAVESNFVALSSRELEKMFLRYSCEVESAQKHLKMYDKQISRLWEAEEYYGHKKGLELTLQRDQAKKVIQAGTEAMFAVAAGVGAKRTSHA